MGVIRLLGEYCVDQVSGSRFYFVLARGVETVEVLGSFGGLSYDDGA